MTKSIVRYIQNSTNKRLTAKELSLLVDRDYPTTLSRNTFFLKSFDANKHNQHYWTIDQDYEKKKVIVKHRRYSEFNQHMLVDRIKTNALKPVENVDRPRLSVMPTNQSIRHSMMPLVVNNKENMFTK